MREQVLETARELARRGLVEGTSGNVSARLDDGRVCMTPSSLAYDAMTADDLVIVGLDGEVVEGQRSPTTEKDLHLACYRRHPDINGVIHCHAVYATMFAVARQPIPAVIEEFTVYVGGEVPVCDYRTTGTAALGDEVAYRLGDRSAALLANHGIVTVGSTLQRALHVAALVERTAKIVWGARLLAEPHALPAEIEETFAGFYRFMR